MPSARKNLELSAGDLFREFAGKIRRSQEVVRGTEDKRARLDFS